MNLHLSPRSGQPPLPHNHARYDGNGLRVEKVAGSTTTVYIFSGAKVIAEHANGAAPSSPTREYIYAGGALLARIDSSGTNYYHQDHLSNRMVTNSSGGVVAEMGHFPFGESWYNATNDKLYFTTYEYDSESGNHYAMARYHVSRLGRLSSPDPLAGSTANPQSLDRYSYSINDPANVTDPSGALPITSCTTAEAKPKDQSQQASGGGHSDTDNSDADTDEDGADADPPPQNGCVSHVNPFGSGEDGVGLDGSDITDLTGDLSGLLGSGGWVGNVTTTGVDNGTGPVPEFVEIAPSWTTSVLGYPGSNSGGAEWAEVWSSGLGLGGLLMPPDSGSMRRRMRARVGAGLHFSLQPRNSDSPRHSRARISIPILESGPTTVIHFVTRTCTVEAVPTSTAVSAEMTVAIFPTADSSQVAAQFSIYAP